MKRTRILLYVLLPLYGILATLVPDRLPGMYLLFGVLLAYTNILVSMHVLVLIDMLRPEMHIGFLIVVALNIVFWLPIAYAVGRLLDRLGRRRRRKSEDTALR